MRSAAAAWSRFWFEPQPTSTLVLVRVAFGVVVLVWSVSLLAVLGDLLSSGGVVPASPDRAGGTWGVLDIWTSDAAVVGVLVATMAAACAVIAGFMTRIAALVVFVGLMSFHARNPFAFNSGDTLLRGTAFFLMLAPSGAAFSVDALRRRGREAFFEFPARAPWALRLVQVQLSLVYVFSVWAKVRGTTWNDGTALSSALSLDDLRRFPLPDALVHSAPLINALTWGTLAVELSVAVLIWHPVARPYVIVAGLGLHLGIDYSLRVGVFGLAIAVSYLAFTPPPVASRVLRAAHARAGRRR